MNNILKCWFKYSNWIKIIFKLSEIALWTKKTQTPKVQKQKEVWNLNLNIEILMLRFIIKVLYYINKFW